MCVWLHACVCLCTNLPPDHNYKQKQVQQSWVALSRTKTSKGSWLEKIKTYNSCKQGNRILPFQLFVWFVFVLFGTKEAVGNPGSYLTRLIFTHTCWGKVNTPSAADTLMDDPRFIAKVRINLWAGMLTWYAKETCPFRIWLMRSRLIRSDSCTLSTHRSKKRFSTFNILNNVTIYLSLVFYLYRVSAESHSAKTFSTDMYQYICMCLPLKCLPLSIPCGCVRYGGSDTAIIKEVFIMEQVCRCSPTMTQGTEACGRVHSREW